MLKYLYQKAFHSRLIKNSFWSTVSIPINTVLGILQVGFTARILGPKGMGLIALFTAVTAVATGLFTFQSATSITTFFPKLKNEKPEMNSVRSLVQYCFFLDFMSSIVIFILLILVATLTPFLLQIENNDKVLFAIFSITVIGQSIYWDVYVLFQVYGRMDILTGVQLARSLLKTLILAILYKIECGVFEFIIAHTVIVILFNISLFFFVNNLLLKDRINLFDKVKDFRKIPGNVKLFRNYGFGQKVFKNIAKYLDTFIVNGLLGVVDVGLFRAAKQVTEMIRLPIQGYVSSLYPEYSHKWSKKDYFGLKKLILLSLLFAIITAFIGSLIVIFAAEPIIKIILGEKFIAAKEIISILVIGTLLSVAFSPLTFLPSASGNGKPSFLMTVIGLTFLLIGMPILTNIYGLKGAAYTTILISIINIVVMVPFILIMVRDIKKEMKIEDD